MFSLLSCCASTLLLISPRCLHNVDLDPVYLRLVKFHRESSPSPLRSLLSPIRIFVRDIFEEGRGRKKTGEVFRGTAFTIRLKLRQRLSHEGKNRGDVRTEKSRGNCPPGWKGEEMLKRGRSTMAVNTICADVRLRLFPPLLLRSVSYHALFSRVFT